MSWYIIRYFKTTNSLNNCKNPSITKRFILLPILIFLFILAHHPKLLNAQDEFKTLIRAVQENSQRSYDEINSVSFKGHSKTYLYFGYSPLEVDIVPYLNEYYFNGFWMKPDSLRMVVKALRDIDPDSSKMKIHDEMPLPNPFRFIYNPSALDIEQDDDDKDIVLWPIYPFAVDADSIYDYHLDHEIGFGENRIFVVHVKPKYPEKPAVIGTFMIDAYRHVVVGSDISFNEATSLFEQAAKQEGRLFRYFITGTNNHRIKTEKELLYGSYWLPTTMEEEFDIGMWGMHFKIHRFIHFDSYLVNPDQPDSSLLTDQKIVYDLDPEMEKVVFDELAHPNRLTKEEEQQIVSKIRDRLVSSGMYAELLESESIAQEASKTAFTQRFGRHLQFTRTLGDYIVYNRVEGLRLHYGPAITNWPIKNSSLSFRVGYGLNDKKWKGEATALYHLTRQKRVFFEGSLYNSTGYAENRRYISTAKNTFTSLLYKGDYRDYYYKKGGSCGIGYRATDQLALKLTYIHQDEENAGINTRFSLFRHKSPFRINPKIVQGQFRGLQAALLYRSHDLDGDIHFEYTDPNTLKSDFSYHFVKANLRRLWRITYYSDLRLHATISASWGALTPQRWFDFGGRMFLNYHGNLRGVNYKAFTGDRMAQATLEYAIKGKVFHDLGIKYDWVKALKLTLWAGVGWSTLSDKSKSLTAGLDVPSETADNGYHEFGLGIGDVLNIFRIDFIRTSIRKNEILIQLNMLQ